MLALPSYTNYGNLSLKFIKIIQRLDHVNRRILEIQDAFKKRKRILEKEIPDLEPIPDVEFTTEEIVASLRKVADELVTLLYLKGFYRESNGAYPQNLEVDSVGGFLYSEKPYLKEVLSTHRGFLKLLNSISNAHKHSFLNSDHNVEARFEPVVFALDQKHNSLKNHPEFYAVTLKEVIQQFNDFYKESVDQLRSW